MARPSIFTPELADKICEELAAGKSLRSVCASEEMPSLSSVFKWLREDEAFSHQYARAKDESADSYQDKIAEIGDDVLNGKYDPQAARVAIDAYKWTASKLKPKKYGDKLELSGDEEAPLAFNVTINGVKSQH